MTVDYPHNYTRLTGRWDGRVLTMNRPDKFNAVDAVMHKELFTIFDDVNLDSAVDIVVLTGAGQAFRADRGMPGMRWSTVMTGLDDGQGRDRLIPDRRAPTP